MRWCWEKTVFAAAALQNLQKELVYQFVFNDEGSHREQVDGCEAPQKQRGVDMCEWSLKCRDFKCKDHS